MNKIKFILPDFSKIKIDINNPSDPFIYYQKPVISWFYINRIQKGLDLLDPEKKYINILEVGYGSGLLLPTLCELGKNIFGIDIHNESEKCRVFFENYENKPVLTKTSIEKTQFENNKFDLIIGFSIFEHLKNVEPALKEMHRILHPEGILLIGMPRVDKIMQQLFHLIGYHTIDEHHFSDYKDVIAKAKEYFDLKKLSCFPVPKIKFISLYYNILFQKK